MDQDFQKMFIEMFCLKRERFFENNNTYMYVEQLVVKN